MTQPSAAGAAPGLVRPGRAWVRTLWLWFALTPGSVGWIGISQAADPMPYTVTLAPTGDAAMDLVLAQASQLAGLREQAQVGPFALLARAQDDLGRLDVVLRSFGYYDAGVDIRIAGLALDDPGLLSLLEGLPPAPPVAVAVSFDPGPLYRLGLVRIEGALPAGARAAFDLTPGEPALAREVLAAGESLRDALREDGFALAQVPPPDALVDHDTSTMDLVYRVEPGPRLVLGEIRVIGLVRLREDVVRRRLGLRAGEPFSPSRLESARRDLLAGGALAWARLTPADTPDAQGRLPLTLEVAERPLRVARLAGAWSSDEGGNLSASWTHRNLFGGAERLELRGEVGQFLESRLDSLSYLVDASLRLPDLVWRDLDLRLDLGAVSESLDAYDREALTAGLALERRLSPRLSASAGLALERAWIAQDGPAQDYRLISLPLTLTHDGSDDLLDPRHGTRLAVRLSPVQDQENDGAGFLPLRVTGSAYLDLSGGLAGDLMEGVMAGLTGRLTGDGSGDSSAPTSGDSSGAVGRSLEGRSVLAGRLVIGSILGASADEVPPDWRLYAGGGGSVRGYPFQSIGPRTPSDSPAGGNGLLEAGLEWRQRLGARWGAVLFVDAGAVSENGIPGAAPLSIGVGTGLRYFTPVGPIRVDLAAPLNHDTGGAAVQLYIGIGQAF